MKVKILYADTIDKLEKLINKFISNPNVTAGWYLNYQATANNFQFIFTVLIEYEEN